MTKALSFLQEGECLDYTNTSGSDIGYRDVVPSGSRIFIAGENIKNTATGTVHAYGVYELPAENTVAYVMGDALYWDETNHVITKTAGTYKAGYAAAPKGQTDTTAFVKIDY